MAMTKRLHSISALAVELDRDRRTIAAALKTVPADGTVAGGHSGWFLATALAALGPTPGDETDMDEAKRRKAVAEAKIAEMAADREAGKLLAREDVDAAVVGAFARVRARLLAVPHKVAPIVGGQNTAEAAETVRSAIWGALQELSDTSVTDMTTRGHSI